MRFSTRKARLVAVIAIVLVMGCMLEPGDGFEVSGVDSLITFKGYHNQPNRQITLYYKANNDFWRPGSWLDMGTTYSSSNATRVTGSQGTTLIG